MAKAFEVELIKSFPAGTEVRVVSNIKSEHSHISNQRVIHQIVVDARDGFFETHLRDAIAEAKELARELSVADKARLTALRILEKNGVISEKQAESARKEN